MKKNSEIQMAGGIACLAVALYLGFNATRPLLSDVYGNERAAVTEWSRVALTLVFGFAGGTHAGRHAQNLISTIARGHDA